MTKEEFEAMAQHIINDSIDTNDTTIVKYERLLKYLVKAGYEQAIKDALEWLKFNLQYYAGFDDRKNQVPFDKDVFEDFKKAMSEFK